MIVYSVEESFTHGSDALIVKNRASFMYISDLAEGKLNSDYLLNKDMHFSN